MYNFDILSSVAPNCNKTVEKYKYPSVFLSIQLHFYGFDDKGLYFEVFLCTLMYF